MEQSNNRAKVCNVAIIAHVDHGKTTLVDQLFQSSDTVMDSNLDRVMDSDEQEQERGITILAKNTGMTYGDYEINIVDTPGHADFGGEVERTLQMVEGFLLLVDAAEGVLPGTRFVLQKALQLRLKPIVIINKVDRKDADIQATESMIHDLFLDLAEHDDQLEFPVLYGSAKLGFMTTDADIQEGDMKPVFDTIIETVPAPKSHSEHLQFLVTSLDYSDFLGQLAIGRVFSGKVSVGDKIVCAKDDYTSRPSIITKMYKMRGLERFEVETAEFGDIICIAGFNDNETLKIGTTVCHPENVLTHPYVHIDEPTISMNFSVNNSPFAGREGNLLTSRQIKERLEKELKVNVALRVEPTESPESFKVSGRGQLHLGVLVENMRREGFELQISAPEVLYKRIDGKKCEPMEHLIIDVPGQYQGSLIEYMGIKKGEMINMHTYDDGRARLEFKVPARGLLGFRSFFMTNTRGTGVMGSSFIGYEPCKGAMTSRPKGALVSMEKGMTKGYALDALQARGVLFVAPGLEVYQGMIIGENSRPNSLDVNPCKGKKLTNMRASGTDDTSRLDPPRQMTLEDCMEWIEIDELIEVTPKSIRLRKKVLNPSLRKKK
jgi:GTP-binding protein